MLIEPIAFAIIALALFIAIMLKMIKNKDKSYMPIIIISLIGIIIDIVEIIFEINIAIVLKIIKYIFAIVIPIVIIAMEKTGISFLERKNLFKAKIYLHFGNNKAAKDVLIEIANMHPESYATHKMLAEIYELEGGTRKAIDEYVQAIDINKQDYDSYYKIANFLTQFDKKDEAEQMLNSLLQKKPEYYKATELLGELLIEKQRYKEAVSVYTEGLKYNPTNYELNYNLGIAFTMLNDFQSAKTYYEKAAELNSLAYNSKYSLAEIAMIYKELEEAEQRFLEVIEENGELEADAYYELAKINMIKGEKEKAIRYANIAVEVDAKKIVPKIKKEEVFIPILVKINMPFNLNGLDDEREVVKKLTEKELMAKDHLEEMVDKTRSLSYSDINLLKKNDEKFKNDFYNQFYKDYKERE